MVYTRYTVNWFFSFLNIYYSIILARVSITKPKNYNIRVICIHYYVHGIFMVPNIIYNNYIVYQYYREVTLKVRFIIQQMTILLSLLLSIINYIINIIRHVIEFRVWKSKHNA